MTELEIIDAHIQQLRNTLISIRADLFVLSEQNKMIANQMMILENVKAQISSSPSNIPSYDKNEGVKDD